MPRRIERLHDALDAFRDVFGASTPDLDDLVDLGGIQLLLDIKDAAEDLYSSSEDEAQRYDTNKLQRPSLTQPNPFTHIQSRSRCDMDPTHPRTHASYCASWWSAACAAPSTWPASLHSKTDRATWRRAECRRDRRVQRYGP